MTGPDQPAGQPDTAPPDPASRRPAQARGGPAEATPGPLVLAVDGTGLLVRCARAGARMGLCTSGGVPTGTLVAFIGALARKLRVTRPDYAVIAWDGPDARAWRQEIYPGYKMNRGEEWHGSPGMELAGEFCRAAGIRQLQVPGFEADDLLASVQREITAAMADASLMIASDDHDLLQLLGDQMTSVTGFSFDAIITAVDVELEWGVSPWWLPCARALCGDPSDNIPGLPGVGTGRAAAMLRQAEWTWPPPERLIPGDGWRRQVIAWKEVMDLVSPPRLPEDHLPEGAEYEKYFALPGKAEWHPEDPGALRVFFRKYELSALSERFLKGRLW